MDIQNSRKKEPLTIMIKTLGCRANQVDSETLTSFIPKSLNEVTSFKEANIVIINTCIVTNPAENRSIKLIKKAANTGARVIVTGCLAAMQKTSLETRPEVDKVFGNHEGELLRDYLLSLDLLTKRKLKSECPTSFETGTKNKRSRPFVNIQNGCDNHCTYCIVRVARGKSKSIPLASIIEQIQRYEQNGFGEVVLTGIHIGAYGRDRFHKSGHPTPSSMTDLLQELINSSSTIQFRLGSIDPPEVTDELINLLSHPRMCRHLHIPIQSTSTQILKRMGRSYTFRHVDNLFSRLHKQLEGLCIGMDLITGFPGETQALFEQGVSRLRSLPFSYLHVFPFSQRQGTPAATFPNQVPGQLRKERCRILKELSDTQRQNFWHSQLQKIVPTVVLQKIDQEGRHYGLTDNYIPVRFKRKKKYPLNPCQIQLQKLTPNDVLGEEKKIKWKQNK